MTKTLIPALGQVGDYEIRLLRIFRSVIECGGISAAETELNIGRSTISIHLKNLENRVGLTLCKRGPSGFALTEEGMIIYQAMQQLFASLESFRSKVNALHVQLTGQLRIVASDTVTIDRRSRLQTTIAEFSEQAPDVNILLDIAPMTEIEKMIVNGTADIGFIPYHRPLEGIHYTHIYDDRCHLYCSDKHPLFHQADEEIIRRSLTEYKIAHAGIHTNSDVGEQLAGLNKSAVAYFYEARLSMILSGKYLGFMPDNFVADWVDAGELQAILPQEKHYNLSVAAIVNSLKGMNRPRDLFITILNNQLQSRRIKAG